MIAAKYGGHRDVQPLQQWIRTEHFTERSNSKCRLTEPEDFFVVDSPVLHLDSEVSQENEVGRHGALRLVGVTLLAPVHGHLKCALQ